MTARKQRRVGVELEWLLEDYALLDKTFQQLFENDSVITEVAVSQDKFFYRVSFIGPIGTDNDRISEELYEFLLEKIGKTSIADDISGVAVNFIGGSYG